MRRRLPSLNALRAFDAAARNLTMTAAGNELRVSPGAVSRQVALLEAHFGHDLFLRRNKGLELTTSGQTFYQAISAAFDQIDLAVDSLSVHRGEQVLRVKCSPTFASEWLLPRLPRFKKSKPDVLLSFEITLDQSAFDPNVTDVAILNNLRDWTGLDRDTLALPVYFPVCSPALQSSGQPLASPSDLAKQTLLHSGLQRENWRKWLGAAAVPEISLDHGVGFENSTLAYRAARDGIGVALGEHLLLIDDLESGRLVAPFDIAVPGKNRYMLAYPKKRAEEPLILEFRTWLMSEIEQSLILAKARMRRVHLHE